MRKSQITTLIICAIVTSFGLGFATLAGGAGQMAYGAPIYALCAALAFAINWLAFIPAALAKTEKFYDLTGALTYISMILLACTLSAPLDTRALTMAAMVVLWCARLGGYLFTRIHKAGGVDSRFDAIKINPWRFFTAWSMQALWCIITASSALVVITADERMPLDGYFYVGAFLWAAGFAIEAIADSQKSRFRADPANKGKFIASGLWATSQHPNYFGEILLWVGACVIALPLLSGWGYLVLLSPVLITLLLTKVSGINLLDKAALAKWGDDPAYLEYRRRTGVLIPWRRA